MLNSAILAGWIRLGLRIPNVRECCLVWGAVEVEPEGLFEANVIGLALAGKLGIKTACYLSADVRTEQNELPGPDEAALKVALALGLGDSGRLEILDGLNYGTPAAEIAWALETGRLLWLPARRSKRFGSPN